MSLPKKRCLQVWKSNLERCLTIRNVQDLIHLVFKLAKHVSLTPFEKTDKDLYKMNGNLLLLYGVAVASANVFLLVVLFLRVTHTDLLDNPYNLVGFGRLLSHVGYTFFLCSNVILKSSVWVDIVNSMLDWDKTLPLPKHLLSPLTTVVGIQFFYFLVKSIFHIYFILASNGESGWMRWLELSATCITTVYSESSFIHFICTIAWLNVYLEALHGLMKEKLLRNDYVIEDHICTVYPLGRKSDRREYPSPTTARRLRLLYGKLLDMKENMNDHYAALLLFTVTSIFIEMVFFVFFIITLFQYWHRDDTNPLLINKFHQAGIETISQIVKLMLTVRLCEKVKRKHTITASIVHKSLYWTGNTETKFELSLFSMEILHRPTRICAAGFFNVDYKLLHSIIGAVTTYTIMLIQFHFPKPPNGENPVHSLSSFI